jgi:hypothetical protein
MRRFGQMLIALGGLVGVGVAAAIAGHLGFAGAPWLVNVALAKLGLIASGGLMAGGAAGIRLANRQSQRRLSSDPPTDDQARPQS